LATTTTEFINIIRKEIGTELTREQIREVTNRAQNEILGRECQLMRVRPDPFFKTVNATYSYAASSYVYKSDTGAQGSLVGDIRTIKEIYSFTADSETLSTSTVDTSSYKPNQYQSLPSVDKIVARIDVIQSIKPGAADCTVKWWEGNNPGATTIDWRCIAYTWPTQITSESVSLSMPEDFLDTLLFHAVMKRIRRQEYGTEGENFQTYEHYYKEFRSRYSHAPTQTLLITYPRDF
jgi:hypothetical protein